MRGLVLVLKITAIAAVAWWVLRRRAIEIAHVNETSLAATLASGWSLIVSISITMAGALFLIGLIDYGYQRWQHEQSLYMSKQEVKEEHSARKVIRKFGRAFASCSVRTPSERCSTRSAPRQSS